MMKVLPKLARGGLATLVAALALQVGVAAAPHQDGAGGRRPPGRREGGPPPNKAEIREVMEQLMISRMREVLQLTPEQQGEVLPQVHALLEARRRFATRRRSRLAYLQAAMLDEDADEGSIEEALQKVREVERSFHDREAELRRSINTELTPRQQARMIFFERHFRRVMQRRVRQVMRQGVDPGRGPGRHGGLGRSGEEDPFEGDALFDLDDWEEE
jgi:hypothetical protein